MATPRTSRTVKVLLHLTEDGRVAIGVIESEWQGARRVDRRLSSARPTTHRAAHAPRGVSPTVWLALCALSDLVDEQEQAARNTPV